MYQVRFVTQMRIVAGVTGLLFTLGLGSAQAEVGKCRREILKRGQKLASTAVKALKKCEEDAYEAGGALGACLANPDVVSKVGKAETKLFDKVADSCAAESLVDVGFAGKVTRCTGGNAAGNRCVNVGDCQFPPAAAGPEDGTCDPVNECPGFQNAADGCDFALAGISVVGAANDVAECVSCITQQKAQNVINAYYQVLEPISSNKDVAKCQIEIGKRASKYFDKVEKTLKKCEDANIKDATSVDCITDPDGKIADALGKMDEKILDTCATAELVSQAIKPGVLYARASQYGSCGTTAPGTPQTLADAVECITEQAGLCDVNMTVGDTACGQSACGNGQQDAGETCDDGNNLNDSGVGPADVCPSDCTVAACTDGGDDAVTISFATPGSVSLYGLTVVVTYNDAKVRIPGSGSDLAVQNALSSLSFGMTPNDSDTSLRNVMLDPFLFGVAPGPAFDITFDTCTGGGPLAAGDVQCIVVDAVDTTFATVDGVTCSVTL